MISWRKSHIAEIIFGRWATRSKTFLVDIEYDGTSLDEITFGDVDSSGKLFVPLILYGIMSYLGGPPKKKSIATCIRNNFRQRRKKNGIRNRRNLKKIQNYESTGNEKERDDDRIYRRKECSHNRHIWSIAIVDDGLLLERMLQNRIISESRVGDILEPGFTDDVRDCYDCPKRYRYDCQNGHRSHEAIGIRLI